MAGVGHEQHLAPGGRGLAEERVEIVVDQLLIRTGDFVEPLHQVGFVAPVHLVAIVVRDGDSVAGEVEIDGIARHSFLDQRLERGDHRLPRRRSVGEDMGLNPLAMRTSATSVTSLIAPCSRGTDA